MCPTLRGAWQPGELSSPRATYQYSNNYTLVAKGMYISDKECLKQLSGGTFGESAFGESAEDGPRFRQDGLPCLERGKRKQLVCHD